MGNEWERRIEASRGMGGNGKARVEISRSPQSGETGNILFGVTDPLGKSGDEPYAVNLVYSERGILTQIAEDDSDPKWKLLVYLRDAPYLHDLARSLAEAEVNAEREDALAPGSLAPSRSKYGMPYPHCDPLVLHALGKCVHCDDFPDAQNQRLVMETPFSGEDGSPDTAVRPRETIDAWGGNRAKPAMRTGG